MVFHTDFEFRSYLALQGGTHLTMMLTDSLWKSSSLPPMLSRRKHRNMIDASALQCHVATNGFVTFSPKELTTAPNILDACEAKIVLRIPFAKRRASDPQLRCFSHLLDQ